MLRSHFSRRMLICAAVGTCLLGIPALAEELMGYLTSIDVAASKVTVQDKAGKDVLVTVTGDTTYETPKGKRAVDLDKLTKNLERAKEKGRKGIPVVVTHEKGVASNIKVEMKKKDAPPSDPSANR
jgi:hypothetical protein